MVCLVGKNLVLGICHSVFLHSIALGANIWIDLNTKCTIRICRLICFKCIKQVLITKVKFLDQINTFFHMLEYVKSGVCRSACYWFITVPFEASHFRENWVLNSFRNPTIQTIVS